MIRRLILVAVALLGISFHVAAAKAAETWTQRPGPVLAPTQPWEANVVQEPTVVNADGRLHMFYQGGFYDCVMGHATSSDGFHWKKDRGPVLGGGVGGEPGNACHSHVYRQGGRFWALYSPDKSAAPDHTVRLAVSADGSSWKRYEQPILTAQGDEVTFGNLFVYPTKTGLIVLYETMYATGLWGTAIATGPDIFHLTRHPFGKLESLRRVGMYGGPWLERRAGTWRLYFHASLSPSNLPTDIYTATSTDLFTWAVEAKPLLWRSQPWQVDQVADACVVTWKGKRLMFFDGFDNREPGMSRIGVAS